MARILIGNVKGPKGDSGSVGPQGPTGSQGPKGDTGADGLGIYTTTQSSLSSGTTSLTKSYITVPSGYTLKTGDLIIGNSSHSYLYRVTSVTSTTVKVTYIAELRGSDGAQGATGAKGDKGETGAQGPTGATGATGATGPQGLKGDTGPVGPQGPKGDTGPVGPQGPKGDTGPQGPRGVQGPAGPQGPAGSSGGGSRVIVSFVNPKWEDLNNNGYYVNHRISFSFPLERLDADLPSARELINNSEPTGNVLYYVFNWLESIEDREMLGILDMTPSQNISDIVAYLKSEAGDRFIISDYDPNSDCIGMLYNSGSDACSLLVLPYNDYGYQDEPVEYYSQTVNLNDYDSYSQGVMIIVSGNTL